MEVGCQKRKNGFLCGKTAVIALFFINARVSGVKANKSSYRKHKDIKRIAKFPSSFKSLGYICI